MNKTLSRARLLSLSVLIALTVGSGLRSAWADDPAKSDEAKADQAKIAAGEETYSTYCSTCHGDDLVNTTGQAFDLRRLKANERPRFEHSVLNGKNGVMPPWKGVLSEEQIDGLWHYIRAHAYEK